MEKNLTKFKAKGELIKKIFFVAKKIFCNEMLLLWAIIENCQGWAVKKCDKL